MDTSWNNFMWLCLYGNLSNMVFCGQGYFMGIMFDEESVKIINLMVIMVWITTNGVLCNLTTANWLIKGLSHISPSRFNCEGFIRRVSTEIPDYEPLAQIS